MSLECGECERDLRGGHDPSCSRYVKHDPSCALLRDEEFECTCGARPAPPGDGTPGPAREAAQFRFYNCLIEPKAGEKPWSELTELDGYAIVPREKYGAAIQAMYRAELGRAPNGWEEAAKLCEEKAAILRKHSQGVGGMGAAAWKIQADILDTMAEVLRARVDAERREPTS